MSNSFYFLEKSIDANKLERVNARDIKTALIEYEKRKPIDFDFSAVIAISSNLNLIPLKINCYDLELDMPVDNFEQMGCKILNLVKDEFSFFNSYNDSKRLTSKNYPRHLAALTLRKDGKSVSTFSYTYSLKENQLIELRYLSFVSATLHVCSIKSTQKFYQYLNNFINYNTPAEEELILQYGKGDKNYRRYSSEFDYEGIALHI